MLFSHRGTELVNDCSEDPDRAGMQRIGGNCLPTAANPALPDKRLFRVIRWAVSASISHRFCCRNVHVSPELLWGMLCNPWCVHPLAFLASKRKLKTQLAPKNSDKRLWPYVRGSYHVFFLCPNMSSSMHPILGTIALEKSDSEYGTPAAGL